MGKILKLGLALALLQLAYAWLWLPSERVHVLTSIDRQWGQWALGRFADFMHTQGLALLVHSDTTMTPGLHAQTLWNWFVTRALALGALATVALPLAIGVTVDAGLARRARRGLWAQAPHRFALGYSLLFVGAGLLTVAFTHPTSYALLLASVALGLTTASLGWLVRYFPAGF
jgi:hypothetical protein